MQQLSFSFEPDVDDLDICILSVMNKGITLRPAPGKLPRIERLVNQGLAKPLRLTLKRPGIESGEMEYRLTDTGVAWAKALDKSAA